LGYKQIQGNPCRFKCANDGENNFMNKKDAQSKRHGEVFVMPWPPWPKKINYGKKVYDLNNNNDFFLTLDQVNGTHVSVLNLSI
jgi:hypothetical protein